MEPKIKDTFRDDFMGALYEMRRAFLKNDLIPPREIVLEGGYEMEMNILSNLTWCDYDTQLGRRDFRTGVEIMGVKVRVK